MPNNIDTKKLEFPANISDSGTYIQFTFEENISKKKFDTNLLKKFGAEVYDLVNDDSKKSSRNSTNFETGGVIGVSEKEKCNKDTIKKNTKASTFSEELFTNEYIERDRILLYFPHTQNITNEINMDWSETDAGLIGSIINTLKQNQGGSIKDAYKSKKDLLQGIGFKKIIQSDVTRKLLGDTADNIAQGYDQLKSFKGVNPKIDSDFLEFNGLNRRTPEFNFRFVAENEEQQVIINNILYRFQLYSYPDNTHPAGILYPFSVTVKVYVQNRLLTSYRRLHIQNVTINENPEGFQFLYDGNSGVIDLGITLKEIDRFYKKDFIAHEVEQFKEQ